MKHATCSHCGGTNVVADAYAYWDAETQQWELDQTFAKGAHCDDCDGETRIEFKETEEGVNPCTL